MTRPPKTSGETQPPTPAPTSAPGNTEDEPAGGAPAARRIRVRGQVQGVGFRPFVWQLARRMGLAGEVLNDAEGVLIHVAGPNLDAFEAALRAEAPPLARIDAVESAAAERPASEGFIIAASGAAGAETRVTPDAATCPACLAEVRSTGRRAGYAFTNCTHCGPRFTIVTGLPYDRAQTTMAPFPLCPACRAEYDDPADRRFHAQPVACPDCGPKLWLEGPDPAPGAAESPLARAAALLGAGQVLAIKGLGGFHLACDATNAEAIDRLRARKHRPAKPFALMAPLDLIRRHAALNAEEADRLADPAAPILLLEKVGTPLPEALAPGQSTLGWMLPATPLHWLLADAVGRPLVMTSGNLSGAPMAIHNAEAREMLAPFADAFLLHDRDIARRLDDSVERITPQGPMILRRARGRVPGTLPLPEGLPHAQVLAMGGQMKAALCLTKNGQALLGHHLGELDEALTWEAFLQAEQDYSQLFDHRPQAVACDLHPGYRATQHAHASPLPVIEVAHHHAHLAACLAENLWPRDGGPVAGIVLDGTGLGPDGTLWGGELLLGDYEDCTRTAHLTPAPLIGGDRAAQEPWRNALARLDQAGIAAEAHLASHPLALARQAARMNAPLSSSAGRLFDAVAALLGLCPARQSFEGEAAMRLEALACQPEGRAALAAGDPGYDFGNESKIDPAPMLHALLADRSPDPVRAARFHAGLARAFASRARALVESGAARAVALSGGCYQNALLLDLTARALADLPLLIHRETPANDGGLALGQAVIALARLESA
ncbi:carbamoyltransferase HypF [Pseudooceanicola nanhaiensis]|uniref:carbamoyltransferase HypF n=1 Tax=Pseudooceanicola nanhaiensis TaxID=375761 RepID=UPI001CD763C8|nr:carbamoyltransferase HypF [Pseudooceanicola nanhaiensis]MCA0919384.1 carbamoyltransferase HypF [Pseudooceanicola nanhaiensis]